MKQDYRVLNRVTLAFCAVFMVSTTLHGDKPPVAFSQTLEGIQKQRESLHARWKRAPRNAPDGRDTKALVIQESQTFLMRTIIDDIVPAWHGMPWTMAVILDGLKPDAAYPFEPGKGISCSWFVVSVLENLGFKFKSKRKFAGSIAIELQRSLAANKKEIHRYFGHSPTKLKKKLIGLGDGIYIIGLNCHIGFVTVDRGKVLFHHSSYVEPYIVVTEELEKSQAISLSEDAGYVVSPLTTRHLTLKWLAGQPLKFKG